MKDLIGKQTYGFRFKSSLFYSPNMDEYVGKIGTVIGQDHYDDDDIDVCRVQFEDGDVWSYPYLQTLDHLVEDERTIDQIINEVKQLTSELWKEKI
jgi:hypothetical protein